MSEASKQHLPALTGLRAVAAALAWWLRQPGAHAAPRFLTYFGLAGSFVCLVGLSLLPGPAVGAFGVMQPAGMFLNNLLLPVLALYAVSVLLHWLVEEPLNHWLRRVLRQPARPATALV